MMASKTSVVEFDSATSHSSEADRSDPFEDSFRKLPFHYHGLSICCYAPLQPHMQHYTCSDCSTVFNIKGVMTLKEQGDYFETDISPYE